MGVLVGEVRRGGIRGEGSCGRGGRGSEVRRGEVDEYRSIMEGGINDND